jgi:hypothetical protein
MNTIRKPIKRSKYLAPLSREHHNDLLFSWKIHRGLAIGIAPDRIARYCNWFYESHLKDHFIKEEKGLSNILAFDHPMMLKMLAEHEAIIMCLNVLHVSPTVDKLEQLAQMVSSHVRFEEREMFNHIEAVASVDQLKGFFEAISVPAPSRQEWSDEFWISSN